MSNNTIAFYICPQASFANWGKAGDKRIEKYPQVHFADNSKPPQFFLDLLAREIFNAGCSEKSRQKIEARGNDYREINKEQIDAFCLGISFCLCNGVYHRVEDDDAYDVRGIDDYINGAVLPLVRNERIVEIAFMTAAAEPGA